MDNFVDGGSVPSSLAGLLAALPVIQPIGSIAAHFNRSIGAVEGWARRGHIAPPMFFGARRAYLEFEILLMPPHGIRADFKGSGLLALEGRSKALSYWIEIVALCGDRFDLEYVPPDHDPRPGQNERYAREDGVRGRGGLQAVCRREGSPLTWHQLPYTYGTSRHRAAEYHHLTVGRAGPTRLIRTVDVILGNLTEQLHQASNLLAERDPIEG